MKVASPIVSTLELEAQLGKGRVKTMSGFIFFILQKF
jgi:hypothetical protein|tara:strand:- start:102 stop:212 length:111 start_codon:yes stop_codon:yes gene_type:complete